MTAKEVAAETETENIQAEVEATMVAAAKAVVGMEIHKVIPKQLAKAGSIEAAAEAVAAVVDETTMTTAAEAEAAAENPHPMVAADMTTTTEVDVVRAVVGMEIHKVIPKQLAKAGSIEAAAEAVAAVVDETTMTTAAEAEAAAENPHPMVAADMTTTTEADAARAEEKAEDGMETHKDIPKHPAKAGSIEAAAEAVAACKAVAVGAETMTTTEAAAEAVEEAQTIAGAATTMTIVAVTAKVVAGTATHKVTPKQPVKAGEIATANRRPPIFSCWAWHLCQAQLRYECSRCGWVYMP